MWYPVLMRERGKHPEDRKGGGGTERGLPFDPMREARAEAERRARELDTALESIADGVLIYDPQGRVQRMNRAAQEIYRYTEEDFRLPIPERVRLMQFRTPDGRLIPPEETAAWRALVKREVVRNSVSSFVQQETGRTCWTSSSAAPILAADGTLQGVIVTLTDITESMRMEQALRRSEARLNRAQEMAHLGGWEMDPATGETAWTDELFRICGLAPGSGQPSEALLRQVVHPEDRAMFDAARREARREGREYSLEHRILRPDGTVRHVLAREETILDEAGRPLRLIGFVQDITAQKRLEGQFLQAQKMESVGRLAGGVAHDFNNLLTIISGNAEIALGGLGPQEPLAEELAEIQQAAERAAELTRKLLAFSRRQIAEPRLVGLNAVLADMERMLRRLIGEHIELDTSLAEGLPAVRIDPGQLEQVLTNLVVNARDAMPAGGRLTIETAAVGLDESYRATHPEVSAGEYVLLAVSDTGCGMDEQVRSHLFEPFFTTKPKGAGTGLGLSTCYGIVKQNGGYIWVYSEAGAGTTVKVYLPAVHAPAEGAGGREAAALPRGAETVLLVEDEAGIRRMAERVLTALGYRLLTAARGEEALALADRLAGRTLQLLITDVVMPGMGGRELAGRLSARFPALKVLYMSGYTENAIVHQGVLENGLDFLQKPFSSATLAQKVREVLGD